MWRTHSYEYNLLDDIVAKILETLWPHARQVTTHAVGLAERVEALWQLLRKARHGQLCCQMIGTHGPLHVNMFQGLAQSRPCQVWKTCLSAVHVCPCHVLAEQQSLCIPNPAPQHMQAIQWWARRTRLP